MRNTIFVNYAHRGASEYAPENTLSAFYLGLQQRANGIETDLRYTKDKKLILFHDDTINRICQENGLVEDLTFEEISNLLIRGDVEKRDTFIPDRIVTFEEFLYRFGHLPLTFALELKGRGVVKETYEMVKKADILEKCIFTSFYFEDLAELRKLDANVATGYLTRECNIDCIKKMQSINITQACLKASKLTKDIVDMHKEAGLQVRAWGIQTVEDMQKMIDFGVDGGMTINFPDKLASALLN